jgi:uncharacterized protein (TIGR00730 family)
LNSLTLSVAGLLLTRLHMTHLVIAMNETDAAPGATSTAEDANLRGQRLQMDYLDTELRLQEAGVHGTIVVFGGTRVVNEPEARQRLAAARLACKENSLDPVRFRNLRIAENLLEKSHYYSIAREFGAIVGKSGTGPADCSLTLMTGGGPGIMEAANRGCHDVGAKSIGLNVTLPEEQQANAFLTPELNFTLQYFAIRKLHFLLRARALVIFPGGYGTLDEMFETLNLIATRTITPLPVILVGESYWQKIVNFDHLVAEGVIEPQDRELFWYAETAQAIWDGITLWHQRAGISLHCPG